LEQIIVEHQLPSLCLSRFPGWNVDCSAELKYTTGAHEIAALLPHAGVPMTERPVDEPTALTATLPAKIPTLRFVTQSDFSQWIPLWQGYNKFYGRFGETALPDEITQTTWARFFDRYEPVRAMVADDSGELVGLVHYLFHRSTISIAPTCYLQDLFTKESSRGLGIGRGLIEAVYEQAKLAGARRVYWHTHRSNATAMKLYDKVAEHSGFVVYRKNI
jgi:GNAT superfamily N-acetyltransferase